jgi:hypothetical protein
MEERLQENTEPRELLKQVGGRDELNLAEFPITLLTDRVSPGQKTLVFEDQVFDQQANEVVNRKLTITGSDAHGLPTAVDDEILVSLIQHTKLTNGFEKKQVPFTRYELLKILGWNDEGRNYDRLEESLNRWVGVTLYYDNAWWNKTAKTWVSEKFHILERVSIIDRSEKRRRQAASQQELPLSFFVWSDVIFQSFRAENLKRLNVDVYFALKSSVSKRMYRFLDKRFFHQPKWEFDLREFAFEHIGLTRSYSDNGKLKEKLQPGIDELTAVGFLEPMSRDERYRKVSRGNCKIILLKKDHERVTKATPKGPSELEEALMTRGVSPVSAAEIVAANPADFIRERIEAFDWMVAKKDKRVSKNPGGFLADSIKKGYMPPKGFESKAEREKRETETRERTRKAAEAKRLTAEKDQLEEQARKARITNYLESLTVEQRETLEEEAFASADAFFVGQHRKNRGNGKLEDFYKTHIIEAHVTKLLDDPALQENREEQGPPVKAVGSAC